MKEILAAFMFFTRLPLGRICRVSADSFKQIVAYWPLVGLLTGGIMTAVYFLAIWSGCHVLIAILLACVSRLLLTGALHEDGLADFFDGFGGGRTREQVLSIMKDSHTGSYGVLGLILYVLLWVSAIYALQQLNINLLFVFFTCDIWSKWCASQIINLLPYARNEEDCKIKKKYERMSSARFVAGFLFGTIPFLYMLIFSYFRTAHNSYGIFAKDPATNSFVPLFAAAIAPVITALFLSAYMKRRIQGYTGDCCGAMFLLCELSYLLTLSCLWKFI